MTSPGDFGSIRVDTVALQRLAKRLRLIIALVAVAVIGVPWLGNFAVDLLWFREVGFQEVFTTSLKWQIGMFALHGGVAFAILYFNIARAKPRTSGEVTVFASGVGAAPSDVARILPILFNGFAAAVALLTGLSASARWLGFLMAGRGGDTGIVEPLFGRDVAYYIFALPVIGATITTALVVVVISLIAVVLLYALKGELQILPRQQATAPSASWHVAGLAATAFALFALRLWIVSRAELLASTTGPLVGASYTDIHARLPGIIGAAIAALAGAGYVLYGASRGRVARHLQLAVIGFVAVNILGRTVVPALVQKLLVAPNELARERPYIERHIAATRAAWGLDRVVTRDLSGDAQLTMNDIRANAATIGNIRLWERDLLGQTLGQLQEIRTYYDFASVSDDRYVIDGKYRQVHLAVRELNSASLPTRSFINERFTYTHGMGLAMAPVNEVTSEGLPVLFVKDLPPAATTSIALKKPQVYYGELTNSYVFTGTVHEEFDHPAGDQNVTTRYTGKGGIAIGSLLRRALFAWRLGSYNILLTGDLEDTSRVLIRRNVNERARTALPFLRFDNEQYPVIRDDGSLVWILDAYTASRAYPYAARTSDGLSYMRNSVKVTVDAYDGTVTAYLADTTDAIALAYQRIFPSAFTAMTQMPEDIRRHLRVPTGIFRIQAALIATYHMDRPEEFYAREDQWQIPEAAQRERATNPFMRHMIMRLPGEKDAEFIYMTPFTPRGKDNLAAWFVARMDGDKLGELIVYRFPNQSLVYGPKQIANRIEQDTDISRQLTLWDQGGSQAIRGELLVIPIEESLIYVQPIYLRAQGGAIPELKRVVVAHGNQVAMGATLEEGLAMVFGGGGSRPLAPLAAPTAGVSGATAGPGGGASATLIDALTQRAQEHYDRAMAAQRAGNWADYGREIEALGAVLRQIRSRR